MEHALIFLKHVSISYNNNNSSRILKFGRKDSGKDYKRFIKNGCVFEFCFCYTDATSISD